MRIQLKFSGMELMSGRILFIIFLLVPISCIAGVPPITVTLESGATNTLPKTGSGSASYVVALDAYVPGTLKHMSLSGGVPRGVSQITSGPSTCLATPTVCAQDFDLNPGSSCCLKLNFDGSRMHLGRNILAPIVSASVYAGQAAAVTVLVTKPSTTLSVTPNLALSVTGLPLTVGTSGSPRSIKVSNNGLQASDELIVYFPQWPLGTVVSQDNCSGTSLPQGGSCTITITPGAQATSACTTGISPSPGVITIATEDASSVASNIVVLGYGCIYQEGYLFSVLETADTSKSIGGSIVAVEDQAPAYPNGLAWDSSLDCATYPYNGLVTNANSPINGTDLPGGNTYIIKNALPTDSPAASACVNYSSGTFSDWYLPAICAMGYGAVDLNINCGSQMSPSIQNIQSNLLDDNIISLLGNYWSSTESTTLPQSSAWQQYFASSTTNYQSLSLKTTKLGVRCVRDLEV